jgi:hypothetical protein
MPRRKTHALICQLIFAGVILLAQSGGRFEEAKRLALAYINSEQFDKAAGRLEEVWEQDQGDPTVGENLALAYLNTEDRRSLPALQEQAFAIIELLSAKDARVSFIVHHSHEKLAWLQGREWNQYCSGRLSITRNSIAYLADKGKDAEKHSFEVPIASLKANVIELDEDNVGVFRFKTPKGGYVMCVRNLSREEAKFLVAFVKRRLSHSKP